MRNSSHISLETNSIFYRVWTIFFHNRSNTSISRR